VLDVYMVRAIDESRHKVRKRASRHKPVDASKHKKNDAKNRCRQNKRLVNLFLLNWTGPAMNDAKCRLRPSRTS
jgi:hypothetical protein